MAFYCAQCGKPLAENARFCSVCGAPAGDIPQAGTSCHRLSRPRQGRKIAGVCVGLANHFGWDVTLVRVLALILAVVFFPIGILAYLAFWLLVPEQNFPLPAPSPLDAEHAA